MRSEGRKVHLSLMYPLNHIECLVERGSKLLNFTRW